MSALDPTRPDAADLAATRSEGARPGEPPAGPLPPYEPPRVTPLGNLRDLLGKSGTNFDLANPRQKRP